MTDKTGSPERIFVTWPSPNSTGLAFSIQARPPAKRTEYIRADLSRPAPVIADQAAGSASDEQLTQAYCQGAKDMQQRAAAAMRDWQAYTLHARERISDEMADDILAMSVIPLAEDEELLDAADAQDAKQAAKVLLAASGRGELAEHVHAAIVAECKNGWELRDKVFAGNILSAILHALAQEQPHD